MKKTLSVVVIIVVLGVVAYYASMTKAPAPTPAAPATDTATAINSSVDAVQLNDPSVDLKAMDTDINAL